MLRNWALLLSVFVGVSACATSIGSPKIATLAETLQDPRVIQFPLQTTEHGRWVAMLNIGDEHMAEMVLDTGATYSAFYEKSIDKFGLEIDVENTTRIHGLIANAVTANTLVSELRLGPDIYTDKYFAVLPFKDDAVAKQNLHDGIIGMDIMQNYRIYIDSGEGQLYFIPNEVQEFALSPRMKEINLFSNPYNDVAPNLHFFNISIKSKETPALLDTGTDVNVINWHAAKFVEARALRSRLKWQWEVAGAIGEFKPIAKAKFSVVKSGTHEWRDHHMLLKDTDSLSILGVDSEPFIIAGIDFLNAGDVYLDFNNDKLWLDYICEASAAPKNVTTICTPY